MLQKLSSSGSIYGKGSSQCFGSDTLHQDSSLLGRTSLQIWNVDLFPPTSLHACFVKSFFVFFARWMHPDLNHFNRVRKWMHTWTIGSIGDDLTHRECMGSWVYGVHHTEVYGILNGNKATKEDMQKKKVPFRRKVGVGKNKPQSVGKWPLQWAV